MEEETISLSAGSSLIGDWQETQYRYYYLTNFWQSVDSSIHAILIGRQIRNLREKTKFASILLLDRSSTSELSIPAQYYRVEA